MPIEPLPNAAILSGTVRCGLLGCDMDAIIKITAERQAIWWVSCRDRQHLVTIMHLTKHYGERLVDVLET